MTIPAIQTRTPVYLIKPVDSCTWYGLHLVTSPSCPSKTTLLTVFCNKSDAWRWAHGLSMYKEQHGEYPSREYMRLPKSFSWVQPADSNHKLDGLEVVEMPFSQVMAMTKGSGVNCSVVINVDTPQQHIEIKQPFDRAAICSKLHFNFAVSLD